MPNIHALLSASSSHRWIECPPSAKLCAEIADKPSEFAQEGTDAHSLCEYKVRTSLGEKVENPIENLTYYNSEMEECSDSYLQYVMEQVETAKHNCKDPIVLIEQRLDFSEYVPHGFGTGDCVIVADENLTVIDYKHGLGVLVEAENNPQMMCYALGALNLFDALYDINTISMTIFQPRRENISTYTITKEELMQWAENVLKPAAELAINGKGEFKAGSHCQFCKVKATCRKRAEYNLQLAQYDFAMPNTLEDAEIEAILDISDKLVSWVDDVKEYALKEALKGKEWTSWKAVEGRSNRKYTDENAVAETVKKAGYDPYEPKVLGITAMTKLLGQKKFKELLDDYVVKPKGKPTLVPKTDKRQAINTAADDFKED